MDRTTLFIKTAAIQTSSIYNAWWNLRIFSPFFIQVMKNFKPFISNINFLFIASWYFSQSPVFLENSSFYLTDVNIKVYKYCISSAVIKLLSLFYFWTSIDYITLKIKQIYITFFKKQVKPKKELNFNQYPTSLYSQIDWLDCFIMIHTREHREHIMQSFRFIHFTFNLNNNLHGYT